MSVGIDLADFAAAEYSQYGEDGMLREVFRRLKIEQGYFVEFGASNGVRLSNTYALWRLGWRGCLIEGDPERFDELCKNIDGERAKRVLAYVAESGSKSLDRILDDAEAPALLDVLSIDVDGDDLALWRGLTSRSARLVVVEYNPTIPPGVMYENPSGANHGNSGSSLLALASERGMVLVAQTRMNLVFLRKADAATAGIKPIELAPAVSYFFGYDGSLIRCTDGQSTIDEIYRGPWAGYVLQPFPQSIRKFGKRDIAKAIHAGYVTLVTRPSQLPNLIRNRRRFTRW